VEAESSVSIAIVGIMKICKARFLNIALFSLQWSKATPSLEVDF
jgi:hypothetical protein